MLIKKAGLIAALLVALGASTPARAETLTDALIAAYRNSNLLDQNRALLRAADEDVAAAVAVLRPVVEFIAGADYRAFEEPVLGPLGVQLGRDGDDSLTASLSVTANLTLYDFGRNALAIEVAKETVLATREALIGLEQDVLLSAVSAYVNVRFTLDVVALRQNNLRLITQELRAAQDRFDVGEITRTDVAIAEARLAESRAALASAEGDFQIAREAYRSATGAFPGRLAPLPRLPRTAASLDEARAIAVRRHPDAAEAQRRVTIASLNIARADAAMKPTIGLSGSASLDQDGYEAGSVGLQLRQTVYAGGRFSAAYRAALADRDSSRANLLQTTLLLGERVGNAWTRLSVANANIEATDRQIRAAQVAFDGVREEATLGARTTLDVLDAEQDLLDARNARLSAEATRYTGVYQVLSAMGLLTVEHLGLGIPTYDPAGYYNAVKTAPATSPQGKRLQRILDRIGD